MVGKHRTWRCRCFIRDLNAVAAHGSWINGHFPHNAAILSPHGLDCNGAVIAKCVRASIEDWFKIADARHKARLIQDGRSNDSER